MLLLILFLIKLLYYFLCDLNTSNVTVNQIAVGLRLILLYYLNTSNVTVNQLI